MNKKTLKTIKVLLVVFAILSITFASIMSQDIHHLDTCTVHNCSLCAIIHIAQIISNLTFAICIYAVQMFVIHFILSKIHKNKDVFVSNSLVLQQVQLNE